MDGWANSWTKGCAHEQSIKWMRRWLDGPLGKLAPGKRLASPIMKLPEIRVCCHLAVEIPASELAAGTLSLFQKLTMNVSHLLFTRPPLVQDHSSLSEAPESTPIVG